MLSPRSSGRKRKLSERAAAALDDSDSNGPPTPKPKKAAGQKAVPAAAAISAPSSSKSHSKSSTSRSSAPKPPNEKSKQNVHIETDEKPDDDAPRNDEEEAVNDGIKGDASDEDSDDANKDSDQDSDEEGDGEGGSQDAGDDTDEYESTSPPEKRSKKQKIVPVVEPEVEIDFTLSLFSPTEWRKPAKKRQAAHTGYMTLASTTSLSTFDRKLSRKISSLTGLTITADDLGVDTHFVVPRHIPVPVLLDDLNAYKHMLKSALKCKDPNVQLSIKVDDLDGDEEKPASDPKPGKKTKKSKIPSENDISPINMAINQKIAVLRAKWACNANDGSDYCWVSPEDKEHIPLGHAHFTMWSAASVKGDCDDDTPPNHKIFETKSNRQLAPLSLLQRRAAANQPVAPPAPVINNIFPEALIQRLLNPNAVAEVPAALLNAHHPPPSTMNPCSFLQTRRSVPA
ncbi:hypothetical protein B0H13DRAFT_2282361 [Mycena leptocephala]|nr:hypothetical protein B0H13DRAFT_2282361 [Mycena leptocephala]